MIHECRRIWTKRGNGKREGEGADEGGGERKVKERRWKGRKGLRALGRIGE